MDEVKRGSLDYPQGDGLSNCSRCKGRGVVSVSPEERPPFAVGEAIRPCVCVLARDVITNIEHGWRGLSQAQRIPESPLWGHEAESLWISAKRTTFQEHLRHVAIRKGPNWNFLVASDADLMDAWLSTIRDDDIIDPDVTELRAAPKFKDNFAALADLVEPPTLLILTLTVKVARNSAMPEVFREALQYRIHRGQPVWVVDADDENLRFGPGHICYSETALDIMKEWPRFLLDAPGKLKSRPRPRPKPVGAQVPDLNPTLDGPEPDEGGTLAEAVPVFSKAELSVGKPKKGKRGGHQ